MIIHYIRTKLLLISTILLLPLIFVTTVNACTRVLYVPTGGSVLVGNNMDWPENMHTDLLVFPRGMERLNSVRGTALNWTSKYGSVVTNAYDELSGITGMNERGFAAHLQGLSPSDYGVRDEKTPGLSINLWAQFYLDNFQTVDEAVKFTQSNRFQIVSFIHPRAGKVQLHVALEDATGDSAIIEYLNGQPVIYHDKNYTVLTNEPAYDKQLENLKQYVGFGGDKPLPGGTFPEDRFVRASYYIAHMSKPKTNKEAIFKLLSVMKNAGQPYGTPSPERTQHGIIFESLWHSVSDLGNRVFYFNSTMRFNTFWVKLDRFNLETGAPVMKLDLQDNAELTADVSSEFKPLA